VSPREQRVSQGSFNKRFLAFAATAAAAAAADASDSSSAAAFAAAGIASGNSEAKHDRQKSDTHLKVGTTRTGRARSTSSTVINGIDARNFVQRSVVDSENMMKRLTMMIKCSDLGHPAQSLKIHRRWSDLYCEETFRQGDMERELNFPVPVTIDRTKDCNATRAANQLGFFDFLVIPLWKAWTSHFANKPAMDTLMLNRAYWHQLKSQRLPYVPVGGWHAFLAHLRRFDSDDTSGTGHRNGGSAGTRSNSASRVGNYSATACLIKEDDDEYDDDDDFIVE
jgi:hypothetical protein